MINEILHMNGYGLYVWSSFIFTLACFCSLYFFIQMQLKKEQKKFKIKFLSLDNEKTEKVKKQGTYKEILAYTNTSKV